MMCLKRRRLAQVIGVSASRPVRSFRLLVGVLTWAGLSFAAAAHAGAAKDTQAEYQSAFEGVLGEVKSYIQVMNLAKAGIQSGDYVSACAVEQALPAQLARLDKAAKLYREKTKANHTDPDNWPALQELERAVARYHSDIPSFNYDYCGKDPAAKLATHVANMKSSVTQYYAEAPRHLDLARTFYQQGNPIIACAEIGQADNQIAGANMVMPRLIAMNPRVQAFPDAELTEKAAQFAQWASAITPLHESYCAAKDSYVAARDAEASARRNAELAAEQAANEERRRQMTPQSGEAAAAGPKDDFFSGMQAWCDATGNSTMQNQTAVAPVCYSFMRK